jgi:SPP1 family predicted phage head-tail adaptor
MRIGHLNKRINFEAETRVSDGMGSHTVTWTTVASSVPAAVWPESASEVMRSERVSMTARVRFRIRYRRVLNPSWRILYAGKYYNMVSIIDPNMAHELLDIIAEIIQ